MTWDAEAAEKGGFETFMLKEIHEQADAVAETIADRLPGDEGVDLSDVALDDDFLRGLGRIVIVACGTSYHAGLIGRYAIEEWARVRSRWTSPPSTATATRWSVPATW